MYSCPVYGCFSVLFPSLLQLLLLVSSFNVILVHGETRNIKEPNTSGTATFDAWPQNLILRPALVLLGTAAVAAALNIILLLASISKAVILAPSTSRALSPAH
jgi:hypothetical protein